jgi:hypothetical protein
MTSGMLILNEFQGIQKEWSYSLQLGVFAENRWIYQTRGRYIEHSVRDGSPIDTRTEDLQNTKQQF